MQPVKGSGRKPGVFWRPVGDVCGVGEEGSRLALCQAQWLQITLGTRTPATGQHHARGLAQRWRSSTLASLWHFPPINETRQHHITAGSWGVLACLPSRSHLACCWRCGRGQAASVPGGLTNRPALAPAPSPTCAATRRRLQRA